MSLTRGVKGGAKHGKGADDQYQIQVIAAALVAALAWGAAALKANVSKAPATAPIFQETLWKVY